jgi:hypothetical protein
MCNDSGRTVTVDKGRFAQCSATSGAMAVCTLGASKVELTIVESVRVGGRPIQRHYGPAVPSWGQTDLELSPQEILNRSDPKAPFPGYWAARFAVHVAGLHPQICAQERRYRLLRGQKRPRLAPN